jgi:glutamate racemase
MVRIGIFDSGIGGLTVLNEALRIMPNEEYIYYADTFNVPYGTKSKEEVKSLNYNIVEFLNRQGIDALVIACNTATSIAINDLRKKYKFPIIGMEPAIKYALEKYGDKRVLALATPLTLKEEKYKQLISKVDYECKVDSLAMPELVEFAENDIFDEDIVYNYFKQKLAAFDMDKYSVIVLGCTHFLYYKKVLETIVPKEISVVDGNGGTVRNLKNTLERNKVPSNKGKVTFYQSAKEGIRKARFDKYMKLLITYPLQMN